MENLKDKLFEWLFLIALAVLVAYTLYHTLPPVALLKLGVHPPDTIVELSGVGAALLYSFIGIVLFRLSVKWVFPSLKLSEFFQSANPLVRVIIAAALILGMSFVLGNAIAKAQTPLPPHIQLAKKYVGVVEYPKNSNSGKEVDMFLRYVGLAPGHSWCAAFVSFCIGRSNVHEPKVISAAARKFVTDKSVRAYDVLTGKYKVPPGSIVVWQRGTTWQGHVGFVVNQSGQNQFQTIEGNTSSGRKGSQFDGGGVYERTRSICLTDHFRIIAFTPVTYL
ncbi:CHAP domain-containing protein [Cytophagaceae bacterium DM2B3-1]|uniref:CHAP domain-containing protein n=1 Tax=Xanthocytophaga flava TaxID=3048013 RepID=A0ABT7CKB2_9BACT|nr:CHAP domain-containing protein [Xanthocytophaga flavus]MDJ1494161.1 CHAP domain-containing protein [Xanthocytophaga flavus]